MWKAMQVLQYRADMHGNRENLFRSETRIPPCFLPALCQGFPLNETPDEIPAIVPRKAVIDFWDARMIELGKKLCFPFTVLLYVAKGIGTLILWGKFLHCDKAIETGDVLRFENIAHSSFCQDPNNTIAVIEIKRRSTS
jgi:hypothetical protein